MISYAFKKRPKLFYCSVFELIFQIRKKCKEHITFNNITDFFFYFYMVLILQAISGIFVVIIIEILTITIKSLTKQ